MKKIRRMLLLAAAALLLLPAAQSRADVTAMTKKERTRVTEITWMDENGKIAAGPEGYATVRYAYARNRVTETYLDAAGNPYRMPGGYYAKMTEKDGATQNVEYYGEDGKTLTTTNMGYARVFTRYFSFGTPRYVIFYGTDKKVVTPPALGYAQMENVYYGTTLTGRIYKDEKGNPVDTPAGYATMKKTLSSTSHLVLQTAYLHADGTPATGPDGWSVCYVDRDKWDRVTAMRYCDTQENPTDLGGCAREERVYDKDNMVTVTRFDAGGNRIPYGGEAVSVRRKMKKDTVLAETFLNEAGEAVLLPEGYATVTYGYDKNGQLETITYSDAAGNKTACVQGYAAIRETRSKDGTLQRRTYLDVNGNPVNSVNGVCEERYEYDESGRLTAVRQFDAAGTPR